MSRKISGLRLEVSDLSQTMVSELSQTMVSVHWESMVSEHWKSMVPLSFTGLFSAQPARGRGVGAWLTPVGIECGVWTSLPPARARRREFTLEDNSS